MELEYNLENVSREEIEEYNTIAQKLASRGYLLKKEAKKTLEFEQKTRICNCCKKSYNQVPAWRIIDVDDRYGNPIPAALALKCFQCELKEIWDLGQKGLL